MIQVNGDGTDILCRLNILSPHSLSSALGGVVFESHERSNFEPTRLTKMRPCDNGLVMTSKIVQTIFGLLLLAVPSSAKPTPSGVPLVFDASGQWSVEDHTTEKNYLLTSLGTVMTVRGQHSP